MMSGCFQNSPEMLAARYAVIDLHLHLDGSLSPASVKELAQLQGMELPATDEELLQLLQVDADCRDLNEYLEKFTFPGTLLQTYEAISTAIYNLEEELKAQGLLYAEIRFAPQKHMEQGLSQSEVVQAAIEGMNRSDFRSNLILCCMRGDDNREQNLETVQVAAAYLGQGVCAIDIAGAEALFPTADFAELFAFSRELGIPCTIHAGEADGPASVYKALDFGAGRIGHGVRSVEDEALLQLLAEKGVVLELCPTSNLNTNVFENLTDYPIRKLLDAGVKITLNTDNTTVSNTTLQEEYRKMIDTFQLTEKELQQLADNAIAASFADEKTRDWLYQEMRKRL